MSLTLEEWVWPLPAAWLLLVPVLLVLAVCNTKSACWLLHPGICLGFDAEWQMQQHDGSGLAPLHEQQIQSTPPVAAAKSALLLLQLGVLLLLYRL